MFVLAVAIVVPVVRSLAGRPEIPAKDVGELPVLTKNTVPSSLLCATALPEPPIDAVVTVAVGTVVSMMIALFAPSEFAVPGAGRVRTAFSLPAFLIVEPPARTRVAAAV